MDPGGGDGHQPPDLPNQHNYHQYVPGSPESDIDSDNDLYGPSHPPKPANCNKLEKEPRNPSTFAPPHQSRPRFPIPPPYTGPSMEY